ncbi:MAG: hypothetical protein JNL82_15355 [Myxococcales bacterium]|nr:hypothetical protein [Myxococcales bacterium]
MQDVQARFRELLRLPGGADPFSVLRHQWLATRGRRQVLVWEKHGADEILVSPPYHQASIRPAGTTMVLRYTWPGRGSRILARGTADTLHRALEEILAAGGPHGGPADDPAMKHRRLALTQWDGPATSDGASFTCFGAGYEARVRPVEDQYCLVLVSPRGSFTLQHFGRQLSMGGAAAFYQSADDAWDDDFHSSSRPFQVRVRGVPQRLQHAPMPGLVGYIETAAGEVYLCLLGVNDAALVLVPDGGEPRCLARGQPMGLSDWELLPAEAPLVRPDPPSAFDRDAVVAALDRLATLATPIKAHLVELVRAAVAVDGTREARRFVWALAAAHEKGDRLELLLDAGALWRRLADGELEEVPGERTRRDALAWLTERSPLIARGRRSRHVLWRVRLDWLSNPTPEALATISAGRERLAAEARANAALLKRA